MIYIPNRCDYHATRLSQLTLNFTAVQEKIFGTVSHHLTPYFHIRDFMNLF